MRLEIIIASTRPGRIGDRIGAWVEAFAREHGGFDIHVADLDELALPLFDEPNHPRLGQYVHEHTKRWSSIVDGADAFVVVTPEYNYYAPPSLVNAVDYLSREWAHKPVGFVGYGATGALRSIQSIKPLFVNLNAMPIQQGVALAGVHAGMSEEFIADERHAQMATNMLDELLLWAKALKPLHS